MPLKIHYLIQGSESPRCKAFGDRIITDIDIFDLREHVDGMVDAGERATTINRKKAVLSSVYKFALSRGYVDENIVRSVVVDDDTKRRDRVLSDEERPKLLKACKESHGICFIYWCSWR